MSSIPQGHVHDEGQHHGEERGTRESKDSRLDAWEEEGVEPRAWAVSAEHQLSGYSTGERTEPTRAFSFFVYVHPSQATPIGKSRISQNPR